MFQLAGLTVAGFQSFANRKFCLLQNVWVIKTVPGSLSLISTLNNAMKTANVAKISGQKFATFFRSAGVCLLGTMLAGCPASNQTSAPPTANPSANGKIVIRGSNTVGEELAPRLIAEFK